MFGFGDHFGWDVQKNSEKVPPADYSFDVWLGSSDTNI